ncbi:MAG: hypothetical protein OXU36_15455 [Candidatus Poribacteria bacterium]|nr:hypothetical protein [Candidatus Poribacteria bacterium]
MNANQRYEARMGFTVWHSPPPTESGIGVPNQNQRYECLMAFKINGIKPIKALPGYEARMGFTAYRKRVNIFS